MQGGTLRHLRDGCAVATNRLERANHMPTTLKRLLGLHAADRRIPCLVFGLKQ